MTSGTIQGALIGALVIVALLQVLAAVQQMRPRYFSSGKHVMRAVWTIAVFVIIYVIGGVPVNWLWAAVLAVIGVALGYVTGRMATVGFAEGHVALKRAAFAPWVLAITYIVAYAFLLFGTADLYSVGLLLVILGVAMDDGAIVAEVLKGNNAVSQTVAT
jgi:hypothetical protein